MEYKDIESKLNELEEALSKIAKRKDVNPKEGESKYGKVEFGDEKNKKYPIDTEEHIRAAYDYFSMPKNREKYSSKDAKSIMSKIVRAYKKKVDKDGPPSLQKTKADMGDDGDDYSCPFCGDNDDSYEHFGNHLDTLQTGVKTAQDKLQQFYENSLDDDLSAQEIMEFVQEIQTIVDDSRTDIFNSQTSDNS